MSTERATSRRTLTPKFWLWRCDNCGLLAYPPEGDEAAEPHVDCPCWKGPRWVRYFAMTPSTPESRDAARRAKALGASVVETVAEAVARGAIPHPPAGKIVSPEAPHYFGPDGSGNATGANIGSPTPPAEDKVVDLMAALEQSIVEAKAARDRKRAAEDHGSPEASS